LMTVLISFYGIVCQSWRKIMESNFSKYHYL
jgi:hypothetical protein